MHVNLLLEEMMKRGITPQKLADSLGITVDSFMNRLNKGFFYLGEIDVIVKELKLSKIEAGEIFFGE